MRTLHKGPFIRNDEHGFEYYLADGEHILRVYNSRMSVSMYIQHRVSLFYKQELRVQKERCSTWADIVWGFEELAAKKYPRNIMRRGR